MKTQDFKEKTALNSADSELILYETALFSIQSVSK